MKDKYKDKSTEEILSMVVEAHEANTEELKKFAKAEDMNKATGDIVTAQKKIHDDLSALETQIKTNQTEYEAEITKLKQGTGWKAEEKAEKLTKQVKAMDVWLRKGIEGMDEDQKAAHLEAVSEKAMTAGSSSEGGFLIIPDTAASILLLVTESSSLRPFATVMSGSSSSWEEPHQTGRSVARYVGEVQSRPETAAPTVGQFKVEANEIAADPQLTRKVLDDAAYDVMGFLMTDVANEIAILEGNAHFNGSGVNQPLGILNAPVGGGIGQMPRLTSDQAGKIVYKDLVKLNQELKRPYRANAKWLAAKETIGDLRNIVDLEGRPLLQPDLPNGGLPQIFGSSVEETFDMEENIAGKLSLGYGDWRQVYFIYDRQGIEVLRNPFKNPPFIIFSHTFRSGGSIRRGEAGRLLLIKS